MNDAPAFAVYLAAGDGPMPLMALTVLEVEVEVGAVSALPSFMAASPRFDSARCDLAAPLAS